MSRLGRKLGEAGKEAGKQLGEDVATALLSKVGAFMLAVVRGKKPLRTWIRSHRAERDVEQATRDELDAIQKRWDEKQK